MIQYPIKKSNSKISLKSASNRGMDLEDAINQTNDYYIREKIAYIYKKPIPIQVVKVDYVRRSAAKISEAYYKIPSTTDYNGVYLGKYIDFEAKETKAKTSFPLKNIHEHQVQHLHNIVCAGGIGFIIVHFSVLGLTFLLDEQYVSSFYKRKESGRKSITLKEFQEFGYEIKEGYVKRLDYLDVVSSIYFKK